VQVTRRAVDIQEKLVAVFPTVRAYREHLGSMYSNLGNALGAEKQSAESERAYRMALKVEQKLQQDYPEVPDYKSKLSMVLNNIGDLLRDRSQLSAAREHFLQAVGYQKQALAANPGNPFYRQSLSYEYWNVADIIVRLSNHEEAVQAVQAMIDVYPDRGDERLWAAQFLAQCVPLAAKDASLAPRKRQEKSHAYTEQALRQLRLALDRGAKTDPPVKDDPALAAIRSYPEFQKLLAEFEARR
jgi:tetratricopeptide (TPR) repeat protein